jgi:hypothetical protein
LPIATATPSTTSAQHERQQSKDCHAKFAHRCTRDILVNTFLSTAPPRSASISITIARLLKQMDRQVANGVSTRRPETSLIREIDVEPSRFELWPLSQVVKCDEEFDLPRNAPGLTLSHIREHGIASDAANAYPQLNVSSRGRSYGVKESREIRSG